jgi:hypothetical protein
MHTCDTPGCVRRDHLELGTPLANSQDMVRKRRSAHSERHSQAVLTTEAVKAMRERHANGEPLKALAAEFGVNHRTAHSAIHQNWKYLPPFRRVKRGTATGRNLSTGVENVRKMRDLYAAGIGPKKIAQEFGLTVGTVINAVCGRGKYAQIPGALPLQRPDLSIKRR